MTLTFQYKGHQTKQKLKFVFSLLEIENFFLENTIMGKIFFGLSIVGLGNQTVAYAFFKMNQTTA